MKWYIWVIIAVVILVIVGLVVKSNNDKAKALAAASTITEPRTFNPYEITPRS